MRLPPFHDYRGLARAFAGEQFESYGWGPVWLAYSLAAMGETSGTLLNRYPALGPTQVLLLMLATSLTLGAATQAVFFSLWLHIGAKLVGGKERLAKTAKIAGYTVFWPGLLVFPAVVVENYTLRNSDGAGALPLFVALGWHILVGVWGSVRALNAVRILHGLPVWKAFVIFLWLPLISLIVGLIFFP